MHRRQQRDFRQVIHVDDGSILINCDHTSNPKIISSNINNSKDCCDLLQRRNTTSIQKVTLTNYGWCDLRSMRRWQRFHIGVDFRNRSTYKNCFTFIITITYNYHEVRVRRKSNQIKLCRFAGTFIQRWLSFCHSIFQQKRPNLYKRWGSQDVTNEVFHEYLSACSKSKSFMRTSIERQI